MFCLYVPSVCNPIFFTFLPVRHTLCLTTSTIYMPNNLPRMKNQRLQYSFMLLMMAGVSPETCWALYKYGIIKFWYIVASCWIFLYEFYYNARIHEYQVLQHALCASPFVLLPGFCHWKLILGPLSKESFVFPTFFCKGVEQGANHYKKHSSTTP